MRCFSDFKLVSYAPYSFKCPLVRNALKLLTQTLNVNVDSSRIAVIFKAPYLIKELISCINSVRI